RRNLTVLTDAHVTRLLIERGICRGVTWLQRGQVMRAHAAGEVIVAAGALQSPHLLQLSGIGPARLLQKHQIPVHVDAPEVGRNLQDHYQARVIVKVKNKLSLNDDVRNPFKLANMGAKWLFNKAGPLTVGAGQVGGMVRTEHSRDGRADILFNVMPLSVDKPG